MRFSGADPTASRDDCAARAPEDFRTASLHSTAQTLGLFGSVCARACDWCESSVRCTVDASRHRTSTSPAHACSEAKVRALWLLCAPALSSPEARPTVAGCWCSVSLAC